MTGRKTWVGLCCIVCVSVIFLSYAGSYAVTVFTQNMAEKSSNVVVIDAGHGGEDGGALSPEGIPESQYNLSISLRLEQLFQLLGVRTVMVRSDNISVYKEGRTIAEKKRSDLKERVKIANQNQRSILLSIHQNHFPDSRYAGAQIFYAKTSGSKELAEDLQNSLVQSLKKTSNRRAKQADGIYLMEHVQNTAILIECGFLSNTEENTLLNSPQYQKELASVIAVTVKNYIEEQEKPNT